MPRPLCLDCHSPIAYRASRCSSCAKLWLGRLNRTEQCRELIHRTGDLIQALMAAVDRPEGVTYPAMFVELTDLEHALGLWVNDHMADLYDAHNRKQAVAYETV